jgi:monofunctional biosynthetic peptidoglycan transglycosylase
MTAPAPPSTPTEPKSAPPARWRWARRIGFALVVLAAAPFVLTFVYRFVPPVSTLMLWRIVTLQPVARTYVPLSAMSPALVRSVVASEDARFCAHWGIDWTAIDDALERAERRNRPVVGVSTISMQVAKNLFLWQGRSYVRKALEVPLTLWLEFVLSKERILEIYLNIAEWGPNGQFGAEAGARAAFGKGAAALSPREAALMATALPNPILRKPGRASARHRSLASVIERRARGMDGYLNCLPALPD